MELQLLKMQMLEGLRKTSMAKQQLAADSNSFRTNDTASNIQRALQIQTIEIEIKEIEDLLSGKPNGIPSQERQL